MKNLRLTEEQFAERQKKLSNYREIIDKEKAGQKKLDAKASPKPSKYKNVRTNGFDSKKEAARYQELVLLEKAGEIQALETQVGYPLRVKDVLIGHYVADYVYWQNGDWVVEDCKGVKTPIYRIKCKLMKAIYGIEIKET